MDGCRDSLKIRSLKRDTDMHVKIMHHPFYITAVENLIKISNIFVKYQNIDLQCLISKTHCVLLTDCTTVLLPSPKFLTLLCNLIVQGESQSVVLNNVGPMLFLFYGIIKRCFYMRRPH